MSIGPLVNLASGYIESLFTKPLSAAASAANTAPAGVTASGSNQDAGQISPFAQVLSSLQQLQQTNPSQFEQVTKQISSNLQTAAQSATASGNTSLANQLNQLSTDFGSASASGQLPNVQDLAQAIGGGHHHHHFHHGGGSSGETASSSAGGSTTGTVANNSLNPLSIIDNTLSSAGIQVG